MPAAPRHELKLLFMTIALVFFGCSNANTSESQQAFEDFKEALLTRNGEDAARRVTQSTFDAYDEYLNRARYGSAALVKKLPVMDQMMILRLRHSIDPETLSQLDGRTLFILGVDKGWIGEAGVVDLNARNFRGSNMIVTADIYTNGVRAPFSLIFRKEQESWKFDLAHMISLSRLAFKQAMEESYLDEEDFMFDLLEAVTGQRPTDDIWNPILKE